jgi:hypothetical protein
VIEAAIDMRARHGDESARADPAGEALDEAPRQVFRA